MRGSVVWIATSLGVSFACSPGSQKSSFVAPVNLCPAHACAAYMQSIPAECVAGTCLVPTSPPAGDLVLVVAVPVDAVLAPGRTYFTRLTDLDASAPPGQPPAVALPFPSTIDGAYVVDPHTANDLLHWELGNAGNTSLPVKVTYRLVWPGPSAPVDALGLGLPADAVFADPVESGFVPPGPAGGPGIAFGAYLAPGTYEQTIAPQAPFDSAFPPDVQTLPASPLTDETTPLDLDSTLEPELGTVIPTFDVTRAAGLDGWTVYLRDATTKRILSPTRALSGTSTPDGGVMLPTSHHPPDGNALTNAELVLSPPAGSPYPTFFAGPYPNVPLHATYPALPDPVTVQGTIASAGGVAVQAQVVFEALQILVPSMPVDTSSDAGDSTGDGGLTFVPNDENFSLIARTLTQTDPQTGASAYSVSLAPGVYRRVVSPLVSPLGAPQAAPDPAYAAGSDLVWVDWRAPSLSADFVVALQSQLTGTAIATDRRPVSQATVEAIPLHCPALADADSGIAPGDSPLCFPRAAQWTTSMDGSFKLWLDPGTYLLRIEPAYGTRLPWVTQTVVVPTSAPMVFPIPAPVYRGMTLQIGGNPLNNAVVRVFLLPKTGWAFEVGRAITDANGRFDIYLDPSLQ